jgi:hypothetical protein
MNTDNKHVKMDERGVEYFYHPDKKGWFPGRKDPRRFLWLDLPHSKSEEKNGQWIFTEGRFYDRPRPYTMLDGSTKRVRITRYTYDEFTRPDKSPKGRNGQRYKFASRECRRAIYWDGERFWQNANFQLPDGRWLNNRIKPFSGLMWDCWEKQSNEQGIPIVQIVCEEGVPYLVKMDGDEYPVAPGEWQSLYAQVLCLRAA